MKYLLLLLLLLTGCSTFKDHFSIGVDGCLNLCELQMKKETLNKKPVCQVLSPRDEFGFKCGGEDGSEE